MKKKNKKLLLTTALCSALVCVGLGCYASLDGVSIASAETTITGEVTATGFTMELGASVKYVGNNGLRFTAKLPKELYQTGNTYGMLIAPQEYVEAQPFTYENLFGENAVYDWENEDGSYTASTKTRIINITYNTLEQLNDDYYTIKGSISNIKDENLSRNFVGLAYVRTPDGYALASYANDNVANNARSIVSVSLAAIDSNEISEDVKATLQTNYIDKAFTPVTYTTTEGYTQFISNDTSDYSNSYFSSSSANTSTLPNGYTTGYTVSAGYGEQYKIFQNFDWNNYSQLKFAFKRANEDSYLNFVGKVYKKEGSSELEKSLDWVEITVKKQANGKWLISHNKEYGEEIATLQDKTIGLSGNFEITELLGIKVNATRYQTVTYLDEEGNLFTTEKVKEGEAAQATTTPTKNDWNENGYNLSYTFSKWTDAEGNPADLSNITAPVTVYASGEIYKSKSYVTDLSKADDRGWVLHQSLTETHGDIAKKDGTVEFYVCAQYNNTLVQIMDNTHWTGTGTTIDAGKWYRFTIIYDKEGKPTEAHLYNENGEIVHTPNAGNSLEGYQVNNLWIYAKTLNSDWSATIETGTIQITTVETVKYVPTYTVTYCDEEDNVLSTEEVKKGNAATPFQSKTENGYTYSYENVKWMLHGGEEAELSNITSDLRVYASGEKWIYKTNTKFDGNGAFPAAVSLNEHIAMDANGSMTFKVRVHGTDGAEVAFSLYDTTGWTESGDNGFGGLFANQWFTIVVNGETKELTVYDASGNKMENSRTMTDYTAGSLSVVCKTGDFDIAAVESVEYVPTFTITYHDEEGNVLSTEKVKKNSAATYSPNKTEGGYTYEYKDLSWLTEVGDEVPLDKITSDLHVYLSAEKLIYKAVEGETIEYELGKYSGKFYQLSNCNKYLQPDKNGDLTFKIRFGNFKNATDNAVFYLCQASWKDGNGITITSQHEWYTVKVNAEKKVFAVYAEDGTQVEADKAIGWYSNGETLYIDLRGNAELAAVETVSYKPTNTCTITYYDAYGEVLATERVKEGNAAKYAFAKDGYVVRQQKWTDESGKEVDLSNVPSDMEVYFCGGYFLETNVTSSTTGLLSSLNEAIRPSANGDLTFKIRAQSGKGYATLKTNLGGVYPYLEEGKTYLVQIKEGKTLSIYDTVNFAHAADNNSGGALKNIDISSWYNFEDFSLENDSGVVLEKYVATENADIDLCGVSAIVYDELSTADKNYGYAEMKYAAEELQYFLEKITGTRIPVRSASDKNDLLASERYILLGSGLAESFDCYAANELTQGTDYKLYRSGNNVYIYGTEKYGTLNGVYGFLNKYAGLEFFSDGVYSYGSDVDLGKEDIFVSTLDEKNVNSFEYAWAVDGMLTAPLETKPETFIGDNWIENWHNWGYQRRLGYVNAAPVMGGGWHNIASLVDKTQNSSYITQITDINENKTDTVLLARDNFAMASVVAEKLYAMHTDTTPWGQGKAYQPGRRMYIVSMPDATERPSYDEGNNLFNTYGTYAAEYTLFINKVAEAFNGQYNGDDGVIHIVLLAYNNTLEAPQATSSDEADKFKLYSSENVKVSVMFAPVEMNLYRPLNDDEHTLYQTEKTNKYYADELVKWKELLGDGGELYFWNYSTYFDNYFTPLDTVNAMQGTYKFLKEQGVTAIYDQGQLNSANSTDWTALKIYLKSCLIKDVDTVLWTDEATMIGGAVEKFFRAYYGGAWETMLDLYATERDWLATLATNSMKEGKEMIGIGHLFRTKTGTIFTHDIFDKKYWDDSPSDGNFGTKNYDSSMLEGWYSKITEALSKTTDKTIKARINVEGLTIRYLLAKVYSNTTNGTMSQIAEDAKALGVTKFNEGVNVDSLS